MEKKILVQPDARGVVQFILNRPAARNAIDPDLIAQARDALRQVREDPSVRAVVLQGAGKDFCAGADLEWMRNVSGMTPEKVAQDSRPLQALYQELHSLPVPLIGVAHGNTMAGGLGMLAACDCVVATRDARFAVSEVRLGLIPAILAPFLARKIGPSMLRYLATTGAVADAPAMAGAGLVHRIGGTAEETGRIVEDVVGAVLRAAPEAIRMCKAMLEDLHLERLDAALPAALEWVADSRRAACAREGISAFLEKRPPAWTAE